VAVCCCGGCVWMLWTYSLNIQTRVQICVQACSSSSPSSWARTSARCRAPRPPKSASAPTTSKTSASRRGTTPFSRCWATLASGTTSKRWWGGRRRGKGGRRGAGAAAAQPMQLRTIAVQQLGRHPLTTAPTPSPPQAIQWAWELSTRVYGLPPDRVWVSVFREDDEAFAIWRDVVGVPEERIKRMDEADNFWSSGPTGAAGWGGGLGAEVGHTADVNEAQIAVPFPVPRQAVPHLNVYPPTSFHPPPQRPLRPLLRALLRLPPREGDGARGVAGGRQPVHRVLQPGGLLGGLGGLGGTWGVCLFWRHHASWRPLHCILLAFTQPPFATPSAPPRSPGVYGDEPRRRRRSQAAGRQKH
jgi:hypothetical protein